MDNNAQEQNVSLTAEVVSAYVSNNPVPAGELAALIASVSTALLSLDRANRPIAEEKPKPPVPIKKSVTPDYLISLEDGKRYKSLKRHLGTRGLTPQEYREKWGLPNDYPMTAPNYSAARSDLAKKLGLGRKPEQPEPKKRGRKKAAA